MSLTQFVEEMTERERRKESPELFSRFCESLRQRLGDEDKRSSPEAILSTQLFHIFFREQRYLGYPWHRRIYPGGIYPGKWLFRMRAQSLYDVVDFAIVPHGGEDNTQFAFAIIGEKIMGFPQEFESFRLSTFADAPFPFPNIYLKELLLRWREDEEVALSELQLESREETNDSTFGLRRFLLDNITEDVLEEFIFKVDPDVVVIPIDKHQLVGTPLSACSVSTSGTSPHTGTAGALALDSSKRAGVTVARHTIESTFAKPTLGRSIDVAGHTGVVVSEDRLTDSCFIELKDSAIQSLGISISSGPSKIIPRQYSVSFFERVGSSGKISTKIQAWSPDILSATAHSQVKVFTDNDLNPGDSGTALLDENGFILGFAFSRAGLNDNPQFSSWIWADSVFQQHHLTAM